MDLVREIPTELSESGAPLNARAISCDARPFEEVAYHFGLVIDAGLATGRVTRPWNASGSVSVLLNSLTWDGNDFLDSVRDDRVWAKVKRAVGKAVGSASLETLKAAAVKVGTELVMRQL